MSAKRVTTVKFFGRPVTNPTLKVLATIVLIPVGIAGLLIGLVAFVVILPLSLPVHFLLVAFGRRGFVTRTRGSATYNVDLNGFKKALR